MELLALRSVCVPFLNKILAAIDYQYVITETFGHPEQNWYKYQNLGASHSNNNLLVLFPSLNVIFQRYRECNKIKIYNYKNPLSKNNNLLSPTYEKHIQINSLKYNKINQILKLRDHNCHRKLIKNNQLN